MPETTLRWFVRTPPAAGKGADTPYRLAALELHGPADVYSAHLLREAVDEAIGEKADADGGRENSSSTLPPYRVLLNLEGLEVMDSIGLGVLIGCQKRLRERGGSLALYGLHGQTARLFQLTGMHKVLPVFASEAEAAAGDTPLNDLKALL